LLIIALVIALHCAKCLLILSLILAPSFSRAIFFLYPFFFWSSLHYNSPFTRAAINSTRAQPPAGV